MMTNDRTLRVRPDSNVHSVATKIAYLFEDSPDTITLRAMGAGAVNQAAKAMAVARGRIANSGLDMVVRPGFGKAEGSPGDSISVVVFRLDLR